MATARRPEATPTPAGLPGAAPRAAGSGAAGKTSGHLWQVDVVRLLTFGAVIAVHVLAFTELPANVPAAGAMMLLQFGREVFFAITGFVLVYAARNKPVALWSFWRRRVPLVAVPYLAWTLIYSVVKATTGAHPAWSWTRFGWDILDGNAWYHLYFLVVTIQLYLVFPWLVRFVRATASRAGLVLGLVTVANLGWLAAVQYSHAPAGAGFLWARAYELLPSYSMYVLAGAYAACHLARLDTVFRRHRRGLWAAAAALAAAALAAYGAQLPVMAPRLANAVLQPAMALTCAAAMIATYRVGRRWADGARARESWVAVGSDLSFGVYLSHPLLLLFLTDHGFGNSHQALPAPLASVLAYMLTVTGAVALTWVLRRTPLSLALTGRPWHRPAIGEPAPAVVPATVAATVSAA